MGYTHYMTGTPVLTQESLRDIRKIINFAGVPLGDWEGPGIAEVAIDRVAFNGVGDDAHETLVIDPSIPVSGFSCCKTARKPYDKVVTAVIMRVREDSPDLKIGSDGDFESEWQDGRLLILDALERHTTCAGLDY